MPCNSDYMNPTGKEKALQQTAQLLRYAYDVLGKYVSASLYHDADDVYCAVDHVPSLCKLLTECTEADRDKLLKADNTMSARLNLWWLEHQKADKARELAEQVKRTNERLRKQALSKLTAAERAALGIDK